MSTLLGLLAVGGSLALIIWWGQREDRKPRPHYREEPGFEDDRWGL